MTDLIERLRARRMLATSGGHIGVGRAGEAVAWITNEPDPDCAEAADEIERLTSLRKDDADEIFRLQTSHSVLYAEVERLRAELLSIRVAAQQAWQSFADGTDMQSSMDRLESVLDAAMKEKT